MQKMANPVENLKGGVAVGGTSPPFWEISGGRGSIRRSRASSFMPLHLYWDHHSSNDNNDEDEEDHNNGADDDDDTVNELRNEKDSESSSFDVETSRKVLENLWNRGSEHENAEAQNGRKPAKKTEQNNNNNNMKKNLQVPNPFSILDVLFRGNNNKANEGDESLKRLESSLSSSKNSFDRRTRKMSSSASSNEGAAQTSPAPWSDVRMYSEDDDDDNETIHLDLSILDVDLRRALLAKSHDINNDGDENGTPEIRSRRSGYSNYPRANIVNIHPLTSIEVERREAEIQLLTQLVDSNEVVDDLWNLWYHEQGLQGALLMQQVEELFLTSSNGGNSNAPQQQPPQWHKAEAALLAIIEKYGTTWAEPINRLATLYYMQGRFVESEQLCLVVLSIKPWHFGALSGLVMVYASLQEVELARQWAAKRLPSLPPVPSSRSNNSGHTNNKYHSKKNEDDDDDDDSSSNKTYKSHRRHQWVQTATRQASSLLKQQQQERKNWWGPKDSHCSNGNKGSSFSSIDTSDKDAWQ